MLEKADGEKEINVLKTGINRQMIIAAVGMGPAAARVKNRMTLAGSLYPFFCIGKSD